MEVREKVDQLKLLQMYFVAVQHILTGFELAFCFAFVNYSRSKGFCSIQSAEKTTNRKIR